MSQPDFKHEKTYRRGLILGLTVAEVMILLMFVLLMALAAALANRDERIKALDEGGASRLIEALQRAYPKAKDTDDYFRELVRAIEARKAIEDADPNSSRESLLADAELGELAREGAEVQGVEDPAEFARQALERAGRGTRSGEWPPFFNLSEAGGYFFESGKATLRPEFERNLREIIIPRLAQNIREYGVNVVEVIGHTDGVPMSGNSNLDRSLIDASDNRLSIGALTSTDNAGLAMARAVAVVRVLRAAPELHGVAILPLSGAQMIVPGDQLADGRAQGSDQRRRRIEIRLRRSSEQENANQ